MNGRLYGMVTFGLALVLLPQAWAQGSDAESVLKAREAVWWLVSLTASSGYLLMMQLW